MFDLSGIGKIITDLFQLIDAARYILPRAGVGAGIEVSPTVDIIPLIRNTFIFLAGIGVIFGVALAFAAKKFAVEVNPLVEKIRDILPGANCGACGYAGCMGYAEAVAVNPDVLPNLCTPGKTAVAEAIAELTGKKVEKLEPKVARVFCQGDMANAIAKFEYRGIKDCVAVVLAGGGDKACVYACLGYGSCKRACPFDAITMSENNLPIIDPEKCTACGKCVTACPKNVIELQPLSKQVIVRCHSRDKGAVTKKNCKVGCIACGICVKVCPYDAPEIENNLSIINLEKCRVCGLCVSRCPTNSIMDYIPHRPKAFVTEKCIGCGICTKVCPVNAASGELKKLYVIDQEKCIGCGICTAKCPVVAITGTFNYQEVAKAAAARKAAKKAKEEVGVLLQIGKGGG